MAASRRDNNPKLPDTKPIAGQREPPRAFVQSGFNEVHYRTHAKIAPRTSQKPLEWKLVEPLIPPAKRGGDKRTVDIREVVNALMYVLSTGCQWRAIPKDLPPRSTAHGYFDLWSWDGTLDRIHHELYMKCREAIGREASPTAAVIDSQSVKSAEKGGPRSAGIRRRQEDQGQKASHCRRYARPADPCHRARG